MHRKMKLVSYLPVVCSYKSSAKGIREKNVRTPDDLKSIQYRAETELISPALGFQDCRSAGAADQPDQQRAKGFFGTGPKKKKNKTEKSVLRCLSSNVKCVCRAPRRNIGKR